MVTAGRIAVPCRAATAVIAAAGSTVASTALRACARWHAAPTAHIGSSSPPNSTLSPPGTAPALSACPPDTSCGKPCARSDPTSDARRARSVGVSGIRRFCCGPIALVRHRDRHRPRRRTAVVAIRRRAGQDLSAKCGTTQRHGMRREFRCRWADYVITSGPRAIPTSRPTPPSCRLLSRPRDRLPRRDRASRFTADRKTSTARFCNGTRLAVEWAVVTEPETRLVCRWRWVCTLDVRSNLWRGQVYGRQVVLEDSRSRPGGVRMCCRARVDRPWTPLPGNVGNDRRAGACRSFPCLSRGHRVTNERSAKMESRRS